MYDTQPKYTQGYWYSKDGQIYSEAGKTLALIPYWDKEDEEKQANMKLLAASPKLLEAAKAFILHLSELPHDTEKCRILKTALNCKAGDMLIDAINEAEGD